MYVLKDLNENKIVGKFYKKRIAKYKPNKLEDRKVVKKSDNYLQLETL